MDAENQARARIVPTWFYPHPWHRAVQHRFDWEAEPWAADGRPYGRAAPDLVTLRREREWAIAVSRTVGIWGSVHSFHRASGVWLPAPLDESLLGSRVTASSGRSIITYWRWDEPHILSLSALLEGAYRAAEEELGLELRSRYSILVAPPGPIAPDPDAEPFIWLNSPALRAWSGPAPPFGDEEGDIHRFLMRLAADRLPAGGEHQICLLDGMLQRPMQQLGYRPDSMVAGQELTFPAAVDAPNWQPLVELWLSPGGTVKLDSRPTCQLLIDYLVARFGPEIIPPAFRALGAAGSMAEWVESVTGRPLDAFELEWRRWLLER